MLYSTNKSKPANARLPRFYGTYDEEYSSKKTEGFAANRVRKDQQVLQLRECLTGQGNLSYTMKRKVSKDMKAAGIDGKARRVLPEAGEVHHPGPTQGDPGHTAKKTGSRWL